MGESRRNESEAMKKKLQYEELLAQHEKEIQEKIQEEIQMRKSVALLKKEQIQVNDAIEYFVDFFVDFDEQKARNLISQLGINFNQKIKTLSKGTKEKVHLVLVLSRNAELYIFDEPIAGVDPAARDLIFKLILENYNKNGTILMATHLILEAETIFDYAFFINNGRLALYDSVENIKNKTGKTLDQLFREIYRYG